MNELRIPLPTRDSNGTGVPQSISYRWCAALHEALQPLTTFKLVDGFCAVEAYIASGHNRLVSLPVPFCDSAAARNCITDGKQNFICRLYLNGSGCRPIEEIILCLPDFLGDAEGAREAFAEVVRHLEEHAVPQIAPEWIEQALAALQGGKLKKTSK